MAVGSPSSSTHSLTTLSGPTPRRPAPLDTSKFTTESPRPTPRDLYSLFPPNQGLADDDKRVRGAHGENRAWFGMDTGLDVVVPKVLSFYRIIGLHSVLPFYVELMIGQDISVLFLLRVFRPFRCDHTIPPGVPRVAPFGSFFVPALIALSYFAERGTWDEVMDTFINSDGDPTQFASIPAAAWFVIVSKYPLLLRSLFFRFSLSLCLCIPFNAARLPRHRFRPDRPIGFNFDVARAASTSSEPTTDPPNLNNIPILHNPPPPASVVQVALNRTRRRRHRHYPASTSHWMKRYSSDPLVLRSNPPTHTARNLAFVYSSLRSDLRLTFSSRSSFPVLLLPLVSPLPLLPHTSAHPNCDANDPPP
ncbi:hypothetical protein D9611_010660 [Ephemerocybe angulata]|uniref:Uncharacterized protein n=1 Tax=Ephemerocybe angulata TaxID=980116 RepID=A0A8H5BBY4_9AGAR|nr:hypothetical protein D9611_010660 [Tulosesus angulatus]